MADSSAMQKVIRAPVREAAGDFAHACLMRWGVWLKSGGGGAQGWAHETTEGRLRREGTLIRGQGMEALPLDDPLAEQVDQIVARLALDDRRWVLMLRVYFADDEATYARVADALSARYGGRVTGERVRVWMREAVATVRGELRGRGLD